MIKLSPPVIKCADVFSACLTSLPDTDEGKSYVEKLNKIKNETYTEWQLFDSRVAIVELHLFKPSKHAKKSQLVIGDVSKEDFVKLYTDYMVKGGSVSRNVYDIIRACSNGLCPLCGISTVTTVDHYLPKARYPAFSIHTKNLVPACDTCNKGKGSSTYKSKESQPLHPYFSHAQFYLTDWIKANVLKTAPLSFSFYVAPPKGWSATDQARIKNHFEDFDLQTKYSVNASQFLTMIKGNIQNILNCGGDSTMVKDMLSSYADNEKPNSTLRVILYAMANDNDICKGLYL